MDSFMQLERKIRRNTYQAIDHYELIKSDDHILVCLSGGKDSYTLWEVLKHYRETQMPELRITAFHLDQKQPGYPSGIMRSYLEAQNEPFELIEKDTYSIVVDKVPEHKTMCSLCSSLRRGTIYEHARRLGANKVALGHHKDDILETFMLNLMYSGKLETMPPKFLNDEGDLEVIRPLAFVEEADISIYAQEKRYPIIPCNLCGSQEQLKRKEIKAMLQSWEDQYKGRKSVMLNALKNVYPTHLLDRELQKAHE